MTQRDLVVGLKLEYNDFIRGADRVSGRMRHMGNDVRKFSTTAKSGFGRANRGLLELSRGAEDFAVSFGTGGLAGGFRGAGNNIAQFATMIHPLAGAFAGFTVAAGAMWLAFNKGADKAISKTKQVELEAKRLSDSFRNLASKQGHEISLRQARGETDDFGAKQQRFDDAMGVVEKLGGQLAEQRKHLAESRAFLEKKRGGDGSAVRAGEALFMSGQLLGPAKEQVAVYEERVKQLETLFGEATKRAEDVRRPLEIANAQRLRAGVVGEGAGINQQRHEFDASLAARRQAAKDRKEAFSADMIERSRLRSGGPLNVVPINEQERRRRQEKKKKEEEEKKPKAPPLTGLATKGSAAAASAIAAARNEAKHQAELLKKQLEEQKRQTELLKNISQTGQAEVVIESFGDVA
jgi:hypothetical protein